MDTGAAHARWGYDQIQLGKPPGLVIEFASRSTYRNDLTTKRDIYRDLKILSTGGLMPPAGCDMGGPSLGNDWRAANIGCCRRCAIAMAL